jgi:hypothetical protein
MQAKASEFSSGSGSGGRGEEGVKGGAQPHDDKKGGQKMCFLLLSLDKKTCANGEDNATYLCRMCD